MDRRFEKLRMPHDYVQEDPLGAIRETFESITLDYMEVELYYWFYMAVGNEHTAYDIRGERANLVEFHYHLIHFIEAMCLYSSQESAYTRSVFNEPASLLEEERKSPRKLIIEFYTKFNIVYIRNELLDYLEAVVSYRGVFEGHIDPYGAVNLYANLLCLVEGGYIIFKKRSHV